jgi:hypothetical protein
MSDFTAIAAVTSTIKALLLQKVAGIAVEETKSPVDLGSSQTPQVGLYLYRVEFNPFFANMDWQTPSSTQRSGPQLGLQLHYLVTPYGPDELEIQRTMGEVMRTFHDFPVIRNGDPLLPAVLANMTEELRIIPHMLSLGDMLDLWRAFESVPYRLCATYEVSAVLIDSSLSRSVSLVQERVIDVSPAL